MKLPAAATSQANDRLTVTMFLAGLFHLILILGVTFAPPRSDTSEVPTLEVLLVDNSLPDSAENRHASYLSDRTQQGSGNAQDGRTREPGAGSSPESAPGEKQPAPGERRTLDADGNLIATTAAATHFVADPADMALPPLPRELEAGIPTPFSGRDPGAALALKGRERRDLLVTPSTRASDVATYLEGWKRRIEQVGTLNFPNEARRRHLSGNPLVLVVLASNGGLVRADIRRSSGHAELDQAALDILKLATPFESFPPDLAQRYDVLRFAYEWEFVAGELAGSSVELPAEAAIPQ